MGKCDQLCASVRTMQTLGILDKRFDKLREDGKNYRSSLCTKSMTNYFDHIQYYIEKVEQKNSFISSDKVMYDIVQLQQASACVGGTKLEDACRELYVALHDLKREREDLAANDNNYKRCLTAFTRMKEEFTILRNCLEDMSYELENGDPMGVEELKSLLYKYLDAGICASFYGIGIGFGFFIMSRVFYPR